MQEKKEKSVNESSYLWIWGDYTAFTLERPLRPEELAKIENFSEF